LPGKPPTATLADLLRVELGAAGVGVGDQHLRRIGRPDQPSLQDGSDV
jgi:hypothetical protein